MTKGGLKVEFDEHSTVLRCAPQGHVIATGSRTRSGLYILNTLNEPSPPSETSLIARLDVWHERFAPVCSNTIIEMERNSLVKGLQFPPKT